MKSQDIEIRATGSEVVYRNRWMSVREDRIVRADGSPGIYGVVQKSDFVVVAAVENGEVWLVEQYRYPVGGRYWELPQGSHESLPPTCEDERLELARDELREETGIVASEMLRAGSLFEAYGYATQVGHVFLATGLSQGECERDAEEQGMVARSFPIDEALAMVADGTIADAMTVAAFGLLRIKQLI
jgi:ADP-ribose pyrophosphatase